MTFANKYNNIARSILSLCVPALLSTMVSSGAWAKPSHLSVPVEGKATQQDRERGCPLSDIQVAQLANPTADNDPVYVFYKGMYITSDMSHPKGMVYTDCDITVHLKYEPGYRYVFRGGIHRGKVTAASGLTTEIATTYRFEDGREFKYNATFEGPYSEYYEQRSGSLSGDTYRSDCSGSSTIKISKLIDLGIMNGSDEGARTKDDDDKDKDDISMAFISGDDLELEWEKCQEGEK